jgi:O-antigen/teichoic acid export membrane protein
MGIVIRQSIKSSIVTYAGVLIGTLNVLWLSPRFLTKEEIGLAQFVVDISLLYAAFAQLGVSQTTLRFFPHFQEDARLYPRFLGMLSVLPLAGLGVFSLAYFLLEPVFTKVYREESPLLLPYYYYLLPLTFCFVYIQLLESFARIHLRIAVPALIRELFLKLLNAGLIVLYGLRWINLNQFIFLLVASYGLAVALLLLYNRNLGKVSVTFDFSFFKLPVFREMVSYGLFVFMGGLGTLLIYKIDALMLSASEGGVGTYGIYTIAFKIAIVIEIPRRAIAQITLPLLTTAWRNNDVGHIGDLYHKSALNQLVVGMFLFLGIWCNIDAIFNLIPNGEVYRAGKSVVLLIALSRLADMATGPNSEIIFGSKYYKYDLVGLVVMVLVKVIANRIFIPLLGSTGAAFADLLVVILYNGGKLLFIWRKFGLQPFSYHNAAAVLIGGVVYVTAMLIPPAGAEMSESLVNIAIRSAVITLLYLGMVYLFRVSAEANILAETIFRKVRGGVGAKE